MSFSEYRYLVLSDLYRIDGCHRWSDFIKELFLGEGYKFNFWFRTCVYTRSNPWLKYFLYLPSKLFYNHYTYKLGISIPLSTNIGPGFYIGHFGSIVVNGQCTIGSNCNISHEVTLGQANRGNKKGVPELGDNVYIGPGAKLVGAVKIGNNVAIGANSVVTKDIADNSVVVGIPGKVISLDGANDYICRTDYNSVING
jgi:serine O-acetyltransferase